MISSKQVLSIGSNKDRSANLKQALTKIKAFFNVVSVSDQYEFDCIKEPLNPRYLNQIVIIQSLDSLKNINNQLKNIEKDLLKIKTKEYCSIDIDLIFTITCEREVSIVNKNKPSTDPYIIMPCAELLPDFIHSEKKLSFFELSNQLKELSFR